MASFLTALADRYCAGRPLLAGRSACATCGAAIGARDLVPILSWLALKGRCRACGATIARRLWIAEVAGLALALAAIWRGDTAFDAVLGLTYLLLLLGLFQTDLLCFRLPDFLTLPLFVAGAGIGVAERGVGLTAIAALIGPAVLWAIGEIYQRRRGVAGLGFGDVKMMAGLSAAAGPLLLPWLTLIAATTALSLAGVRSMRGRPVSATDRVPFGSHLAAAGALIFLFA